MTTMSHDRACQVDPGEDSELSSALDTLLRRIEAGGPGGTADVDAYTVSEAEIDVMLGMHRAFEGPADAHAPAEKQTPRVHGTTISFPDRPVWGSSKVRRAAVALALMAAMATVALLWPSARDDSDRAVAAQPAVVPASDAPTGSGSPAESSVVGARTGRVGPSSGTPEPRPVSTDDLAIREAVESAITEVGVTNARVSVDHGVVTVEAVAPVHLLANGYFARVEQLERLAAVDGVAGIEVRLGLRGDAALLRGELMEITAGAPILFDSGSAALGDADRETLRRVAAAIASQPGLPVIVAGTTDSSGSVAANERLAQERAAAVAADLVSHGVPANRLRAVSYGELFGEADGDARTIRFEVGP